MVRCAKKWSGECYRDNGGRGESPRIMKSYERSSKQQVSPPIDQVVLIRAQVVRVEVVETAISQVVQFAFTETKQVHSSRRHRARRQHSSWRRDWTADAPSSRTPCVGIKPSSLKLFIAAEEQDVVYSSEQPQQGTVPSFPAIFNEGVESRSKNIWRASSHLEIGHNESLDNLTRKKGRSRSLDR